MKGNGPGMGVGWEEDGTVGTFTPEYCILIALCIELLACTWP